MKIKLLGTAASEGIPAIFCNCKLCREASQSGGKNIRRRSGTLIDGDFMIEYGPDLYMHKLNFKLALHKIKHVLISHSHTDHFVPTELQMMTMPVLCERDSATIHIYGNEKVQSHYLATGMQNSGQFEFHLLREGEQVQAGDKTILPLKAEHDSNENCYVFLIEKSGKSFFYGHDSGYYSDNTWKRLQKKHIDLAVLDCVAGLNSSYYNHMGLNSNILVKEKMLTDGIADEKTRFVITHFSHHRGFTHEQLENDAGVKGFITAYDGIEFDI